MRKFILAEDDENSGGYHWTNINRRDHFTFEGAWAEDFDSEEWAIVAAEQRTREGWIVDSFRKLGYTVEDGYDKQDD